MYWRLKSFINRDKGMGTVEIVIIIAVLVGIALIFRDAIINFAVDVMEEVFGDPGIVDDVGSGNIRDNNRIN